MRDTIDTNRLTLRPVAAQDCGRIVALLNDWEVARMLARIAHPYTEDDFHGWQSGHAAARAAKADFPYAICTASDGVIGCMGVAGDSEIGYELGYWLGRAYWGRGYATEAGASLLAYANAELGAPRYTSRHFEENEASGQVLQKLGFSYTGIVKPSPCMARGHDVAARLMERMPGPKEERS